MKGAVFLIVFFLLITSASIIMQSPMFPGNIFCALLGDAVKNFSSYLSAIFNGIFYGIILWLIFVAISKRLEEQK